MRGLRPFLAVLFLITACGVDQQPLSDGSGSGDVENVYRDNCSRCHGLDGDGTSTGPQIRNPVHGYAMFVIRNGRGSEMGFGGSMPSFGEDQVPDVEPIFTWLERPPHPMDGPTLYTRYCGNCHGPDAQGGRVNKDITHEAREGVHELTEKIREGHGGTNYSARTKYMPSWSADDLSDADVAAITSYIASLPAGSSDGDDDDDDD